MLSDHLLLFWHCAYFVQLALWKIGTSSNIANTLANVMVVKTADELWAVKVNS
jgi:hypothetical protein